MRDAAARRDEGRVDRRPARARRIEDVANAFLYRHGYNGSNTCTTSSSRSRSAEKFSAIGRSATRASRSGSMPCSRRSCCRHIQGVGTSDTVANRSSSKSASLKPARSRRPTRKNGSRATTSQKQTSGDSWIVVTRLHHAHGPAQVEIDRAVEQCGYRSLRNRRGEQFDLDAFARIEAERVGRVERRVEQARKFSASLICIVVDPDSCCCLTCCIRDRRMRPRGQQHESKLSRVALLLSRCLDWRARCSGFRACRQQLSEPPHPARRAGSTRRRRRFHRAHDRRKACRRARPAGRHQQSGRRRRHDRLRAASPRRSPTAIRCCSIRSPRTASVRISTPISPMTRPRISRRSSCWPSCR